MNLTTECQVYAGYKWHFTAERVWETLDDIGITVSLIEIRLLFLKWRLNEQYHNMPVQDFLSNGIEPQQVVDVYRKVREHA